MKVILLEDIEAVGKMGDTVNAIKFYASGIDWYMDAEKDDDYLKAESIVKSGKIASN